MLFRYIAWRRLDVDIGYGAATVDWGRGEPDGRDLGEITADEFIWHRRRRSWAVRLDLGLDEQWRCDFALINVVSTRRFQSITLERRGDAAWKVNGRRRRVLDGCVEIDIGATPLTNALPIRQLELNVGEERLFRVAWVEVPSLKVTAREQGYRRVGPLDDGPHGLEAYDFWPVGGRTYRLTVDGDGLVVDYEDFAERISP